MKMIDISDTVFIGDGPRDEEAARRAAIKYLMVDWGFSDNKNAIVSVEKLKKEILDILR